MPTPQEQAEYEQYLKETGQHPSQIQDNGNWQKLSELGSMLSPGSEWSMPSEQTLSDPVVQAALKSSARQNLAAGAGGAAGEFAGLGGAGATGLGAGAKRAITGGAINAAAAPEGDRLKAFLLGSGIQGGLESAGALGKGIGDRAMQWAVGRTKYTPGVGIELANQGLIGTKGMMKNQVANQLENVGGRMQDVASQIPSVNARDIGNELMDREIGKYTGNGINSPSVRDIPAIDKIKTFGEDIAARGDETGLQGLARRKTAGSSAFSVKSQEPLQNLTAKLSKAEQQGYSQALKAADPRMIPLDATYGALKRAELPLNADERIGGFTNAASALAKGVARPIASTVGQAGVKGGKLATFLAPILRQAAVTGMQDPGPSPQELSEYDQYLRETGQK